MSFHFIPPIVLQGKHDCPPNTDEDMEAWEGSQDVKSSKTKLLSKMSYWGRTRGESEWDHGISEEAMAVTQVKDDAA